MKFTIIAALATVAMAQSLTDLPSCATTCASSSVSGSSCELADTACLCTDETFAEALATCVTDSCSEADQESSLTTLNAVCDAAIAADDTAVAEEDIQGDAAEDVVGESATASPAAIVSASTSAGTVASYTTATRAVGTGGVVAPTNGTGYAGAVPTQFAGGAEMLKAGQWMGFAALFALVAL